MALQFKAINDLGDLVIQSRRESNKGIVQGHCGIIIWCKVSLSQLFTIPAQ